MSMFKAQFVFAVGRRGVTEVAVPPRSGIKQGDPLFPAVFVMVCFVRIHALKEVSPDLALHVLFYVDDSVLSIPLPPRLACDPPPHLRVLGIFVVLKLNLSKSTFITKGVCPEVVGKLLVIRKVALRLNSWGVTPPLLALPPPPPQGRASLALGAHLPPLTTCHLFYSIHN